MLKVSSPSISLYCSCIALLLFVFSPAVFAGALLDPKQNKMVAGFVKKMHAEHAEIPTAWLKGQFENLELNQNVLASIQRPAESMNWSRYRKLFITQKRINQGALFMQTHSATLQHFSKRYGIPAEIVVAILGVETNYGDTQGSFSALEALATLAFYYVPRHDFFTDELKSLLVTAWHHKWNLKEIKGSYAGALGIPQFMPSNVDLYARPAINQSKDVNLFSNKEDAIHSVFHYLKARGSWLAKAPIIRPIHFSRNGQKILRSIFKRNKTASIVVTEEMRQQLGIRQFKGQAWILCINDDDLRYYYLFRPNFNSIMTYNNSSLYALAVVELAQKIVSKVKRNEH